MRGRALLLVLAVVFAALAHGGAASAVAVERIPLADGSRPETADFPPGVFLKLVSPPEYVARAPGRWVGPAFWPSGDAAQRGESTIDWSVTFRDRSIDVSSAAASVTPRGWREHERAGVSIPHVFGRVILGTVPSYFVLKQSDAMHEAALAIPLSPTVMAIVKFTLRSPATNSAGPFGENLVLGTYLASTWNRGQAFLAVSGVQLEGNLPPSIVSIRAIRGRPAVRGRVVDALGHPLVGIRVALERQVGAGWRRVGSVKTSSKGTYMIAARGPGRYRTSASLAGVTVQSASLPLR